MLILDPIFECDNLPFTSIEYSIERELLSAHQEKIIT